jgi:D-glycerate 3-kinase
MNNVSGNPHGPVQLAEIILDWSKDKAPTLIGLAGLPGSGKTTLAALLVKEIKRISDKEALSISLDDFYLRPEERKARGLRWRAVPGSHDLKLLDEFLKSINSETKTIEVPRYDTRAEVRLDQVVQSRPDIVIFDGWLIGARACGYEQLEMRLTVLSLSTWTSKSHTNRV